MRHDDTAYFFKHDHYAAFAPARHKDQTLAARHAREAVQDKLVELEGRLSPKLIERGLDLHPHYDRAYLTSRVAHREDGSYFHSPKIQEIWLHYGRSKTQTDRLNGRVPEGQVSPVYQMRIQATVTATGLGIWLRIGMPGAGIWEKEKLRAAARPTTDEDRELLAALWAEVQRLREYHLWTGEGNRFEFSEMESVEDLQAALRTVRVGEYAMVSLEIVAGDDSLTEGRILETVAGEVGRLCPVYALLV